MLLDPWKKASRSVPHHKSRVHITLAATQPTHATLTSMHLPIRRGLRTKNRTQHDFPRHEIASVPDPNVGNNQISDIWPYNRVQSVKLKYHEMD